MPHVVIEGDALTVIPTLGPLRAVFTSLPDQAEVGLGLEAWRDWFTTAARLVAASLTPTGYAVFYQTDRRQDGRLHDKAALITAAAEAEGARVVWHKIAVRTTGTSLFRPGYSHLLAVSRRGTSGRPTPDVYDVGTRHYPDATDSVSLDVALDFLQSKGATHIVDPFAGRGSIARAAALRGLDTTSVDIDPAQVAAIRAEGLPELPRAEGDQLADVLVTTPQTETQ